MPAFLLPDLGEGLAEAEIVAWHVHAGDTVTVDQSVAEVETAKAVVEVPVPFAGRVTELHGQVGDVVTVGQPLITVEPPEPVPAGENGSAGESGRVLIGYGTSGGRPRRRRSRNARPAGSPLPASPAAGPRTGTGTSPASFGSRVAVASPLIRQLARSAGVDLTAVRGSGRDGLITRRDVDAAIEASRSAPPAPPPAVVPAAEPAGLVRIPLRGRRKAAADKLSRSRREIPEATVWVDVDATGLAELRKTLNTDTSRPPISLLALLARFTILGLRRHPELNARIEGDEIVLNPSVHLGFAAQTDRGLVVPVVPGAHALTLEQLSAALAERTRRAREGSLGPAELTGGTFTVNNYGVFGVDGSAAIINYPEAAILGMGRIIERPWVVGGAVVARQMTELTLAFDHRICDGGTAGGFLRFVADCIESPATTLRHL